MELIEIGKLPDNINTDNDDLAVRVIAGEDILYAHVVKIVLGKAYYCNSENDEDYGLATGLTMTSALTNQLVKLQVFGTFSFEGLKFEAGADYFLNGLGTISTEPGTIIIPVGNAISEDVLNIKIGGLNIDTSE